MKVVLFVMLTALVTTSLNAGQMMTSLTSQTTHVTQTLVVAVAPFLKCPPGQKRDENGVCKNYWYFSQFQYDVYQRSRLL